MRVRVRVPARVPEPEPEPVPVTMPAHALVTMTRRPEEQPAVLPAPRPETGPGPGPAMAPAHALVTKRNYRSRRSAAPAVRVPLGTVPAQAPATTPGRDLATTLGHLPRGQPARLPPELAPELDPVLAPAMMLARALATTRNRHPCWAVRELTAPQPAPQLAPGTTRGLGLAMARRFLRNLIDLYGAMDRAALKKRIEALEDYFSAHYPGQKDESDIQRLKSMCREWEAECTWGYLGWNCESVRHLRLSFYTGDIFTREPTVEGDVVPVINLLEEVNPDIVGVALDPEASGPDTHYKVLQAITEALRRYEASSGRSDIKVWGYRNVWFRFHPSEADIFVPVSLNMLSVMHSAFMNTFISQRDASFPSYEHDGPFSELARKVQVDQYQKLKTCLGRAWFHEHPSPLIRATRGLVYLKEMPLDEFYERSRALMLAAENRQ